MTIRNPTLAVSETAVRSSSLDNVDGVICSSAKVVACGDLDLRSPPLLPLSRSGARGSCVTSTSVQVEQCVGTGTLSSATSSCGKIPTSLYAAAREAATEHRQPALVEPCDDSLSALCKRSHFSGSDDDSSIESTEDAGCATPARALSRRKPPKKQVRRNPQSSSPRVHFAECLVEAVHYRPKTSPEDKHNLHYTFAEMDRFRQDYYRWLDEHSESECYESQEEAKEADSDLTSFESESEGDNVASWELVEDDKQTPPTPMYPATKIKDVHLVCDDTTTKLVNNPSIYATPIEGTNVLPSVKNSILKTPISKVTVIHRNIKEDYYFDGQDSNCAATTSDAITGNCTKSSSGSPSLSTLSKAMGNRVGEDDYFFDNPAFWNGTLTYY